MVRVLVQRLHLRFRDCARLGRVSTDADQISDAERNRRSREDPRRLNANARTRGRAEASVRLSWDPKYIPRRCSRISGEGEPNFLCSSDCVAERAVSRELFSASDCESVVGYKRPPKASQFQKGKSGNPGGRTNKPVIAGVFRKISKQKVRTNGQNV